MLQVHFGYTLGRPLHPLLPSIYCSSPLCPIQDTRHTYRSLLMSLSPYCSLLMVLQLLHTPVPRILRMRISGSIPTRRDIGGAVRNDLGLSSDAGFLMKEM